MHKSYGFNADLIEAIKINITVVRLDSVGAITGFMVMCIKTYGNCVIMYMH